MSTKWEYLTVIYRYRVLDPRTGEALSRDATVPPDLDLQYVEDYRIQGPDGKEPEIRTAYSSKDEPRKTDFVEIANELGQQGWELVGADNLNSKVFYEMFGFWDVSSPLRRAWMFKRPAAG